MREFLSVPEAGELLGVGRARAYVLAASGALRSRSRSSGVPSAPRPSSNLRSNQRRAVVMPTNLSRGPIQTSPFEVGSREVGAACCEWLHQFERCFKIR